MEDEEVSTEETVIEPARNTSDVASLEERVITLITDLTQHINAIDDRLTIIESDASNDNGNGDADGTEQPAPLSSVSEPIDNPEAETPHESGDGSGTVKQPRRQHPYYRKRWG